MKNFFSHFLCLIFVVVLLHEEQVEMELAEVNGPPFECNNMGGRSWSEENDITDFLNDNSFICTHFGYFDPSVANLTNLWLRHKRKLRRRTDSAPRRRPIDRRW